MSVPPGRRAWGTDSVAAGVAPRANAESFPPILALPVVAEMKVTPVSETVVANHSMDVSDIDNVIVENSHVTIEAPPVVAEVEVTPGPSGVSPVCVENACTPKLLWRIIVWMLVMLKM